MVTHNPNELVAVVDENDKVIGADTRKNVHEKGLLHREIAVIVFNKKNEILLQKRKDNGRYGFSAAGHFSTSENYLQGATREAKEEKGIKLKESELKEITKLRRDVSWDGLRNNVFLKVFEAKKDLKIGNFNIDIFEVDSVGFFSIEQIEKMISENPENARKRSFRHARKSCRFSVHFGRGFRKIFNMFYKTR